MSCHFAKFTSGLGKLQLWFARADSWYLLVVLYRLLMSCDGGSHSVHLGSQVLPVQPSLMWPRTGVLSQSIRALACARAHSLAWFRLSAASLARV